MNHYGEDAYYEAEGNAAEAQAEHEYQLFIQEQVKELEKQIDYHERKISEYLQQIKNLQDRK